MTNIMSCQEANSLRPSATTSMLAVVEKEYPSVSSATNVIGNEPDLASVETSIENDFWDSGAIVSSTLSLFTGSTVHPASVHLNSIHWKLKIGLVVVAVILKILSTTPS